jgi:hypothetical protein
VPSALSGSLRVLKKFTASLTTSRRKSSSFSSPPRLPRARRTRTVPRRRARSGLRVARSASVRRARLCRERLGFAHYPDSGAWPSNLTFRLHWDQPSAGERGAGLAVRLNSTRLPHKHAGDRSGILRYDRASWRIAEFTPWLVHHSSRGGELLADTGNGDAVRVRWLGLHPESLPRDWET